MGRTAEFYGYLADAVALLHAAFVLFVVVGEALIIAGWMRRWSWTQGVGFRVAHLGGIGFVMLEAWWGVSCPLTVLENKLRALAARESYEIGFIAYWIDRLLYYDVPQWMFTVGYTLFGILVLSTYIVYPPRRKK